MGHADLADVLVMVIVGLLSLLAGEVAARRHNI